MVGATSALGAIKTDRRVSAFMINDAIATAGLFATVYETAARLQIG